MAIPRWRLQSLMSDPRSRCACAGGGGGTPKGNLPLNPLLPFYLRRDFESQSIQPNKSCRVILIVGLGRIRLHRGNLWIVEA